MTVAHAAAGAPRRPRAGAGATATRPSPSQGQQRISGVFQLLLALYILFTGNLPTIIQALAFGLAGSAEAEFSAAMVAALTRDLLLLAPVVAFARHPLGILHPLILAVVVWPLLMAMPAVMEQLGGWAAVVAGVPVSTPFFVGLPSHSGTAVWTAIAKYNGLEILALVSTYAGFWFFRGGQNPLRARIAFRDTMTLRSVLIGLIAVSTLALLFFLYSRGGLVEHLSSLGRGRFRQLHTSGAIILATDLGSVALLLWVASRPGDIKSPLFLASLAIATGVQFISNGSRGSALAVPLLVGLVWALRRQKVPWKIGLLLAPLFFVSLGLLSAVRTAGWTGSSAGEAITTTGWSESLALAQEEIELRRSLSAQVPIVERGFSVVGGPMLGRSYWAALFAFIPRSVWEDKPRGPGSMYAQYFLGEPREGRAIPVSATAEMFWNFGVVGVLALSFAYGALLRVVYHFYWRRYPSPFAIVLYVLFITTFHFSTDRLVDLEQQLALLLVCWLVVTFLVPKTTDTAALLNAPLAGASGHAMTPSHP